MLHDATYALHNKTVDRFNREKLYIQLMRIFLEEISTGKWRLEEKIPSEDELCKKYHVSKITVRQAINNLSSDGYLMKIQGKGTFVTSAIPVVGLAMKTRFTEEMFGQEVQLTKELLIKGITEPPTEVKAYLKTDDRIYQFLCRRMANSNPAYLDESYVPYSMLPGIEGVDIINSSFYSVLQEKAIMKVFKMIQTVEILNVDGISANYLDIQAGVPVLAVHRLLLSSDSTPVGYTRFIGRSDRYKFQTEFERIR